MAPSRATATDTGSQCPLSKAGAPSTSSLSLFKTPPPPIITTAFTPTPTTPTWTARNGRRLTLAIVLGSFLGVILVLVQACSYLQPSPSPWRGTIGGVHYVARAYSVTGSKSAMRQRQQLTTNTDADARSVLRSLEEEEDEEEEEGAGESATVVDNAEAKEKEEEDPLANVDTRGLPPALVHVMAEKAREQRERLSRYFDGVRRTEKQQLKRTGVPKSDIVHMLKDVTKQEARKLQEVDKEQNALADTLKGYLKHMRSDEALGISEEGWARVVAESRRDKTGPTPDKRLTVNIGRALRETLLSNYGNSDAGNHLRGGQLPQFNAITPNSGKRTTGPHQQTQQQLRAFATLRDRLQKLGAAAAGRFTGKHPLSSGLRVLSSLATRVTSSPFLEGKAMVSTPRQLRAFRSFEERNKKSLYPVELMLPREERSTPGKASTEEASAGSSSEFSSPYLPRILRDAIDAAAHEERVMLLQCLRADRRAKLLDMYLSQGMTERDLLSKAFVLWEEERVAIEQFDAEKVRQRRQAEVDLQYGKENRRHCKEAAQRVEQMYEREMQRQRQAVSFRHSMGREDEIAILIAEGIDAKDIAAKDQEMRRVEERTLADLERKIASERGEAVSRLVGEFGVICEEAWRRREEKEREVVQEMKEKKARRRR